jgi:hypothetical protein
MPKHNFIPVPNRFFLLDDPEIVAGIMDFPERFDPQFRLRITGWWYTYPSENI